MIVIDYDKCCWKDGKCVSCGCGSACDGCVEACPVGALERQKNVVFHPDKCIDCGVCITACKYGAVAMKE
ncbi:MAG: 4Fe-4S binding protein [Candidatus Omnitrophota bacterium]